MPGPARHLQPGEELIYDLHPHWRRLVVPFVAVPALAALTTFALLAGPEDATFRLIVLGAALVLLSALSGLPYLRWRTTHYVVTDRRVLGQSGILTRVRGDVPLRRLTDVQVERSLPARLTRSGDLVLESADEAEGLRLVDVPRVDQVQDALHRLLDDTDTDTDTDTDADADDGQHRRSAD